MPALTLYTSKNEPVPLPIESPSATASLFTDEYGFPTPLKSFFGMSFALSKSAIAVKLFGMFCDKSMFNCSDINYIFEIISFILFKDSVTAELYLSIVDKCCCDGLTFVKSFFSCGLINAFNIPVSDLFLLVK